MTSFEDVKAGDLVTLRHLKDADFRVTFRVSRGDRGILWRKEVGTGSSMTTEAGYQVTLWEIIEHVVPPVPEPKAGSVVAGNGAYVFYRLALSGTGQPWCAVGSASRYDWAEVVRLCGDARVVLREGV